jgi:alpha-tubulin suppressor-like RCC1 family protein
MAWGANAKGQLGDGTTTTRKTPVLLPESSSISAIAAGGTHSLAWGWVGDQSEILAWGNNSDGQLGDGTTTTRKTPIVVPGQGDAQFFAAGGAHSITLR